MMKDEFYAWCKATGNYSSTEKIDWLLNAISVLEKKVQYHIDNGNNLYSIIKQQQAKAHEISNRTAVVHPEVERLQKEITDYKDHISKLNAEITNFRTVLQDRTNRLGKIWDLVQDES